MHTLLPLTHTFGPRYEVPIPQWMFAVGGAGVVFVSFLLLVRRQPRAVPDTGTQDRVPATAIHPVAATVSGLVVLAVALTGLLGTQETATNLAPTFFWVLVWIGVPMSCGLVGDWTRPVNPFANLARLADRPAVRKVILARSTPLDWTYGWWPSVVLFVLLVLSELVFNLHTTVPSFIGTMLLVYAVLSFFLGLLYGDAWLARGEVFSALFDAWGRLGWFRHGAPGRRGFAGGLDQPFETSPSRVVFVLLLLVSINFDGLLATPQWANYERRTYGLRANSIDLLRTATLVALVLVVLAVFMFFAYAAARAGRLALGPLSALAVVLPSLVPIAFGYLIAHNLQYVITNGQEVFPLLGNPGFSTWPIHLPSPFNSTFEPHRFLLPNSAYWYVALVAIIAVHVVAVVLANQRLTGRAPDSEHAHRSEYPWLVAMVAYTAFSLFLIAQPLTQESNSATDVSPRPSPTAGLSRSLSRLQSIEPPLHRWAQRGR